MFIWKKHWIIRVKKYHGYHEYLGIKDTVSLITQFLTAIDNISYIKAMAVTWHDTVNMTHDICAQVISSTTNAELIKDSPLGCTFMLQSICIQIIKNILQIVITELGNIRVSFVYICGIFNNLDPIIIIQVDAFCGHPWHVTDMSKIEFILYWDTIFTNTASRVN